MSQKTNAIAIAREVEPSGSCASLDTKHINDISMKRVNKLLNSFSAILVDVENEELVEVSIDREFSISAIQKIVAGNFTAYYDIFPDGDVLFLNEESIFKSLKGFEYRGFKGMGNGLIFNDGDDQNFQSDLEALRKNVKFFKETLK